MDKPRLWSLNALSNELGRNMRTVSRAMKDVPPDGTVSKHRAWKLSTALAAMRRYENASDRFPEAAARDAGNWRDIENYSLPAYLDAAATAALAMLDRMFLATTIEERRAAYDQKLFDAWYEAFERQHREMGPEFEAANRPTQELGREYYRVLIEKMLAGEAAA